MKGPDSRVASDHDKWADVISNAEDHVRQETSGVASARRPLPGRGVLMGVVGLIVAISTAVLLPRMFPGGPVGLSVVEQASDLRAEAALLVEQIEAFRRERGTLPDASMLAPFLDSGYEYRIIDQSLGKYEVRRSSGGVVVTYDGTLPLGLWVVIGGSASEGGA